MTLTRSHPHAHPALVSRAPTASAPANVAIGHVQLRDLVLCPAERGVLWYTGDRSIVEQDIISTGSRQRPIALLTFTPVTLAALPLPSSSSTKQHILLAAGGQNAELFLALYQYTPRRTRDLKHKSDHSDEGDVAGHSTQIWHHDSSLVGSINNNVLLYQPPPAPNSWTERPAPRLVVSNNDCTVKFFDVCLARSGLRRTPAQLAQARAQDARYWRRANEGVWEEGWGVRGSEHVVRYERVGCLRLPVPVNHTSISPDGSTILSCGDASTVYLHRILPVRHGATLLFEPLAQYNMPVPTPPSDPRPSPPMAPHALDSPPSSFSAYLPFAFIDGAWVVASSHPFGDGDGNPALPACFTTAWSADGMKFAVASQEGVVRVWDVRSNEPLAGAGWVTGRDSSAAGRSPADMQWFEQAGTAPPWAVRALKFAKNASGREVLVFTEHESLVHVIDADTFEVHDVLRVPHVQPIVPRAQYYPSLPDSDDAGAGRPYDGGRSLNTARYARVHGASQPITITRNPTRLPRAPQRRHAQPPAPLVDSPYRPGMDLEPRRFGSGRILTPSRPFTRSPEPSAFFPPPRASDWHSSASGSEREDMSRMWAQVIRRRRQDLQMEEDIAFHANHESDDDDGDGLVVIPPLPSARSEEDVRSVLAAHGIAAVSPAAPASSSGATSASTSSGNDRTRAAREALRAAGDYAMETSVDEADETDMLSDHDCLLPPGDSAVATMEGSSSAPEAHLWTRPSSAGMATPASLPPLSLTSSTTAGDAAPGPPSPGSSSSAASTMHSPITLTLPSPPSLASPVSPTSPREGETVGVGGNVHTHTHTLPPCRELIESTERLDVAGVAFDPSGAYMYVATVDGLTEWSVQGVEQRWWSGGGWM
ncbi:hypothetical protein M0805_001901 [Coniferiporia weirii]|nr:hypothetical protein M0805_001901 [Coniferiporia weirii]